MGIYKKGNNWYIDYYLKGRRKRKKIGPSKKLAELTLKDVQIKIAKSEYLGIYEAKKMLFRDFAILYLDWSRANKAPKSHERDTYSIKALSTFFNGYLSAITTVDVETYKAGRIKEVEPATVNREVACLRHMLNLAIRWTYLRESPAKGVKMLKEPPGRLKYLSKEEIHALLPACPPHLRSIVVCALNTGMRKGEIFNLRWADVNLKERRITIRESKTNELRTIPINETLLHELKELPIHFSSNYVFWNKDRGGERYKDLSETFERRLKEVGIEDFRFHDLRHTFASHLAMRGVSLRAIAQLLGHKTLQMVMRYSHLSPEHLQGAVGVLDELMGSGDGHQMDTGKQVDKSLAI